MSRQVPHGAFPGKTQTHEPAYKYAPKKKEKNNMKTGRNLQEVLVELNRQNKAKQDFISPAQGMRLREDL